MKSIVKQAKNGFYIMSVWVHHLDFHGFSSWVEWDCLAYSSGDSNRAADSLKRWPKVARRPGLT